MKRKASLRQATIAQLKELSPIKRHQWEEMLKTQLLDFVSEHQVQKLAFFYGFRPEIDTAPIIDELLARGIEVYLPRLQPEYQMSFHRFTDPSELEIVQRKIYQPQATRPMIDPSALDLVIVPGLLWDDAGYRIGFGGGYYDRFLEQYPLPTVSLLFPFQLATAQQWEVESFDIPVRHLLVAATDDAHD